MNRFKFVPFSLQLSENDSPQKVQLLKTGKFKDMFFGDFEIKPEHLSNMKKNFDDKVRGVDLAIDYSHMNHDVAAGWIKELESTGTELWATVDWTPPGREKLKNKEFRYLSAEFSFEYEDNESDKKYGPTLYGAGLTNRPFVKNMAPAVQLSEGENMDEKDKKIAQLEADLADSKKALEAQEAQSVEMKSKLDSLEAEVKKASEEKELAEKKAKFDKLLTEGKVVEAQRDAFMSGDAIKLAELAQNVKLTEKGTAETNVEGPSNKEEAEKKILELAEKKLAEKQVKTIGEGILSARKENPELVKLIKEGK